MARGGSKKGKIAKVEIVNGQLWCPNCSRMKDISEFYLSDGWPKRPCKECKIKYQTEFYEENKEEVEKYRKQYYRENREEIIARQSEYDKNRVEERKAYQARYRQKNKATINATRKQRLLSPEKLLHGVVSHSIYLALRKFGSPNNDVSCFAFLEYSISDLKNHMERLFLHPNNLINGKAWMTWKNRGRYNPKTWDENSPDTWTWQLDHIIPRSTLPYDSMEHPNFKKCWALENLRPLNAKQNIYDGATKIRHKMGVKNDE